MKANILLISCHDLGDHLASYPGNSAQTPNLVYLAAEGMLFEQHFSAASTCSPSWGAMLTGLMPHRNGLMALASGGHWAVSPKIPVLPQLLQGAGYATACFGTWYIGAQPRERSIEVGDQDNDCDRVAMNATRYLQRYLREDAPKDKPFFLMVNFSKPHESLAKPWSDLQKPEAVCVPGYLEDAPEVRLEMARFYGEVSCIDAAVGQVLDTLWECGLNENTLVIFTSDHGIAMPLAKGTLYDPGIKIPLIVTWNGRIRGGLRSAALTSNVDVVPTILEAIGESDLIPPGLDGHSLWPCIERGENVAHPYIFAEQTWHDFYEPMRAIRSQHYKLIRNFEPGIGLQLAADILHTPTVNVMRETLRNWPHPEIEFYDLAEDPGERHNAVGSPETLEIERALTRELDDWLARTADPILHGGIPAPSGYWEHFWTNAVGPGGLPPEQGREVWSVVRRPAVVQHRGRRQGLRPSQLFRETDEEPS